MLSQLSPGIKPGYAIGHRFGAVVPKTSRPSARTRAAISHEYSTRVPGDAWRVSQYVSDYGNLPQWYPGVGAAYPMDPDAPLAKGTQFKVEQNIAGQKLTTTYQVAEYIPEKRIVYLAKSDLHTATEQFVFMPDPNAKDKFTFIRYMSSIELREWRKAMQPLVQRPIEKMTEGALQQLTRVLSAKDTPLRAISGKPRPKGGSTWGSMSSQDEASTSSRSYDEGDDRARFFAALGKGAANVAGMAAGAAFNALKKAAEKPKIDVLGYYKILGLDAKKRGLTDDDVKSAFRKAAQTMHPDKVAADAPTAVKEAAEATFKKVQIAYKVLKDPETRMRYNAGEEIRPELSVDN